MGERNEAVLRRERYQREQCPPTAPSHERATPKGERLAHQLTDREGAVAVDPPWTIRTYAGHSSARASNALYRSNLEKGQTGLSIAFDLPTQCGYDSDDSIARPEVGKVGVPINSLDDFHELFDKIPIDKMNTSMMHVRPFSTFELMTETEIEAGFGRLSEALEQHGERLAIELVDFLVLEATRVDPVRPRSSTDRDLVDHQVQLGHAASIRSLGDVQRGGS